MSERFGHLKSSIEALKLSGIREMLVSLSKKHDCDLIILDHKSYILRESYSFKFSGYESNLKKLNENLQEILEEYNESPLPIDNVSIKNAQITILNAQEIHLEVKASSFSNIKEMIYSIAKHTGMDIQLEEKNIGLFKGKEISMKNSPATGKQLRKFVRLFEGHVKSDEPIQIKNKM